MPQEMRDERTSAVVGHRQGDASVDVDGGHQVGAGPPRRLTWDGQDACLSARDLKTR